MNIRKAKPSTLHAIVVMATMLFAFGFSSAAAGEQTPAAMGIPDNGSDQDRKRLVAENLPLTESEAQQFWPIYEHYQQDVSHLVKRRKGIISRFGENFDEMTDAMAKQIALEQIELQEARLKLLISYFPKFERVLPGKKLARYLQIEARIRAAVDAEIAERIPLIK